MAKVILFMMAALIAVLYQLEADPSYWTAHSTVRLDVVPDEVMRFLTNVDQMEKWFGLVSYVRQADFKPVGVSKQYHAIYNIPWLGEYAILFKVVDHEANTILHLESESLLKPKVEFIVKQAKFKETYLTIRMQYRRNSILFQVSNIKHPSDILVMSAVLHSCVRSAPCTPRGLPRKPRCYLGPHVT